MFAAGPLWCPILKSGLVSYFAGLSKSPPQYILMTFGYLPKAPSCSNIKISMTSGVIMFQLK